MQALHCSLSGIRPRSVNGWDEKAKSEARNLIFQATSCEVRSIVNEGYHVVLRTDSKSNSSVNQFMVDQGLAERSDRPNPSTGRPQRGGVGGQRGGLHQAQTGSYPRMELPASKMSELSLQEDQRSPVRSDRQLPIESNRRPVDSSTPMDGRPPFSIPASCANFVANFNADPFNLGKATDVEKATPEIPPSLPSEIQPVSGREDVNGENAPLLRRVEELERLVETQNAQIAALQAELRERMQSPNEERFVNLETEIAALKRAHEGLVKDLIKKKVL